MSRRSVWRDVKVNIFIISLLPVSECRYRPQSQLVWGPGGARPDTLVFLLAANIKHHDVNQNIIMVSHLAFLSGYFLGDRATLFSRHLGIKESINEDIKKILMISIQMSP